MREWGDRMELRHLKTFQIVAEELNITRAAKRLKYTQPTITLQIQALEKELNHTLLTRVGKKTMLTTSGERLKQHVDQVFTLMDKMERDMEALRGPSGVLTIAASEYYCRQYLHPLVKQFAGDHPDVKVSILPLNSVHALQSIRDRVADIAIIASECGEVDIQQTFLEEEPTFLVASSHIAKNKSFADIISSYPFISYNDDCSFSAISHHYFQTRKIEPQSIITVGGSDEMIKQAVLNNVGYAILGADILKNELREETITILEKVNEPIVTSAIHLKVRADETNIRTFTAFLQREWLTVQEKLLV